MEKYTRTKFIENGYLNVVKKHENSYVETHFHDFFELEYIISGSGTYTVDGKEYRIEEGDLFLLTPFNFHSVDIHNAELYNVMFSGDICSPVFIQNIIGKAPVFLKSSGRIKTFFESVLGELCENAADRELSIALLDAVVARLEKETSQHNTNSRLSVISRAELYILNNFRNRLTLEDVAAEVALSPTYFSRLFRKEKGMNFKAYLDNMRFEYAIKLLENSNMTVVQVCNESGFNDYPNFVRRFKVYTGYYPEKYRKRRELN